MITTNPSLQIVANFLNADLADFYQWCGEHKMIVNIPKTKAQFVGQKRAVNKIMEEPPVLNISDQVIEILTCEKLPGIHVDNTLSWAIQVESTIKKCNSLLHLLNRIKQFLSVPVRKMFYNAYILPHLDYCCTIWGNTNNELTKLLVEFQKRAARSILDESIETPSSQLFSHLNWMTFPQRVEYQKAILMYKIMHNLAPTYLSELVHYTNEIHNHVLRSTHDNHLYVPKPNTELFRNSFSYSGSNFWNAMPDIIKHAISVQQFKCKYLEWKATDH